MKVLSLAKPEVLSLATSDALSLAKLKVLLSLFTFIVLMNLEVS